MLRISVDRHFILQKARKKTAVPLRPQIAALGFKNQRQSLSFVKAGNKGI
jgi:hypothetical protein